jgi:acetyl esterase/lipase
MLAALDRLQPEPEDVVSTEVVVESSDGVGVRARWYVRKGAAPGSAVVYAHGGGMILGDVDIFSGNVARYVSATGVPSCRWTTGERRSTPDPELVPFVTWSYEDNATGWQALLGAAAGTDGVPAHAAPARVEDTAGLPPAYIEVGQLDVFRDEDLAYAIGLSRGGVPVELHLHPGAPHEFDGIAVDADVTRRARADRVRVLTSI